MPVRVVAALVALALTGAACSGRGSAGRSTTTAEPPPTTTTTALPPLIASELDVADLTPESLLVADGVSFGRALGDADAGLASLTAEPFVTGGVARVAYDRAAAPLADVTVLALDPASFHDADVLNAFVEGFVSGGSGAPTTEDVGGTTVAMAATGRAGGVVRAFVHENLVAVVSGDEAGTARVTQAMVAAMDAGQVGDGVAATPVRTMAAGDLFIPVPDIGFQPFPTEEEAPPPPTLPGRSTATESRIVVIGGERRAIAWVIAASVTAFPTAEALQPAIDELAAARYHLPVTPSQIGRRPLLTTGPDAEGSIAAVFRHQNLVVVVEGRELDQVQTIASAWSAAIGVS